MAEISNGLPPGWDRKFDEKSGKFYYVHHYSRATTWEDPRGRPGTPKYTSIPVEHIPLQHRSPEIRRNSIHPNYSPPREAFLANSIHIQDNKSRSPLKLRNAKVADSSQINFHPSSISAVEDPVAKISAMFPTVSETHIKFLLTKYLNREALVISALQVEKYPITTPGPFATPPPQRNIQVKNKDVSRSGSPHCRASPSSIGYKSASSPKLKLRYMKSIFPHADETLILECLQNNENSIQKTSENLGQMGYSRKETVKPSTPNGKAKTEVKIDKPKTPVEAPKLKTNAEKLSVKQSLKEKYQDVPEHLISMALESVNFDEKRAIQILKIVQEEDTNETLKNADTKNGGSKDVPDGVLTNNILPTICQIPITQSRQSIKSLLKCEKKENVNRFSRIIDNPLQNLSNTCGPNSTLVVGPNQSLLLENYVQWQGSNNAICKGTQGYPKGPNKSLISIKSYQPCGPNLELCKGPNCGFAKGSIFSQMNPVVVGESRLN